jgi:6-phosphofructokinase 1
MVSVSGQAMRFVPLAEVASGTRTVPLDSDVLQTGRDLGLCFGDEAQGTFLATVIPPPPGASV